MRDAARGRVLAARSPSIASALDPFDDLARRCSRARSSTTRRRRSRDGGIIRAGFDAELDELRSLVARREGLDRRATRPSEVARTGIPTLQGRLQPGLRLLHRGHERATRERVPPEYVRKQTLTNAERYITPELQEYEEKVLARRGARAGPRAASSSASCATRVAARIAGAPGDRAASLAELDALASLAEVARRGGYVRARARRRPRRSSSATAATRWSSGARRRRALRAERRRASTRERRIALITGPNMAGKTTYIRQVALIVLLAQIGSFVPARKARDRRRATASSRASAPRTTSRRGQSTFMVEMIETAQHPPPRDRRAASSILDEVGRGTSTLRRPRASRGRSPSTCAEVVGARTLFATHYHELTAARRRAAASVKNLNVAVREWGDADRLPAPHPGGRRPTAATASTSRASPASPTPVVRAREGDPRDAGGQAGAGDASAFALGEPRAASGRATSSSGSSRRRPPTPPSRRCARSTRSG